MKKLFFLNLFMLLLAAPLSGQNSSQTWIDRMAKKLKSDTGIEFAFQVKGLVEDAANEATQGRFRLRGERFLMDVSAMRVGFDGSELWSYDSSHEEVTLSRPGKDDLETINPFGFLNSYQKNYRHRLGSTKSFRGKQVVEVEFTAIDRTRDWQFIRLYVDRTTHLPLFIQANQKGGRLAMEIIIGAVKTGQNYARELFAFDRAAYSQAEIIHLQ